MDILNERSPAAALPRSEAAALPLASPRKGASGAVETVYDAADGRPLGRLRGTAGNQVVIAGANGPRVLPLHLVTIRQELRA